MKKFWILVVCALVYGGISVLVTKQDSTYMGVDLKLNTFTSMIMSVFYFYGAYTIWKELISEE